jgi:cytoskeletal protein CcmA (bactofilin family)
MADQEARKTENSASSQSVPFAEPQVSPERRPPACISKSVIIQGNVISAVDLTIDGQVEGTIELGGQNLTVGAGATILADLKAPSIIISGAVTGNVTATERIEIRETGSVDGDLTAPRLAVRDGATLRGRIDTIAAAPAKSVQPFPVAV